MDLVERVEIVRGAGSSLYGSNAFFGVINLITRRGRDVGASKCRCWAGTQRTLRRAHHRGRPRRHAERIPAVGHGRRARTAIAASTFPRSRTSTAASPATTTPTAGSRRSRSGAPAASRCPPSTTSARSNVPTAPFNAVFDDGRNQTTDTRAWLEGRYDGVVAGGNLTARAAVDEYRYDGDLVQRLDPDTINQDRSQRDLVVGRSHVRARDPPGHDARGRRRGAVGPAQRAGERRPHVSSPAARHLRALLLRDGHDAVLGAVRAGRLADRAGMGRDDRRAPRSLRVVRRRHRPAPRARPSADRRPDVQADLRPGLPRAQRLRALLQRRWRLAEGESRPAAGAHPVVGAARRVALRARVARRGRVLLQPDHGPHRDRHRSRPTACSST